MSWKKLARSLLSLILSVSLALPGCTRPPDTEQTEQYRFDKAGRLCLRIAPDGGKIEYRYNQDGLPVEIRYPGGWVKYGYDADGRRIWMQDETGVTEYYYDALYRPVGVSWKHGADKLLIYDYDGRGNLSYVGVGDLARISREVKYRELLKDLVGKKPEQVSNWGEKEKAYGKLVENLKAESPGAKKGWLDHEVTYHYDMFRRLTGAGTPQGRVTYDYDNVKGQVQRLLPNGITSTFTYAPDGSLKSLQHEGPAKELIARYQYDYNQAGKVVTAREATPQETKTTGYVWDNRGYLQEVNLPDGGKVRYDYDAMGNRTLKEDAAGVTRYTYDKFGRLSQAGNQKYQWDVNGNLIAQTGGPHQTRITYDGRNQPVTAKTTEGKTSYRWDGDGNPVFRQDKTAGHYYLPNPLGPPGNTLAEFDKSGKPTAIYIYGDVLLAKQDAQRGARFFLEDGFNSIRLASDRNGQITGKQDFDLFGQPTAPKSDFHLDFRKANERYLPEIKSYVVGDKLYDPNCGRYSTPDRSNTIVGRPDSFNKYVNNNTPHPSSGASFKIPFELKTSSEHPAHYWGMNIAKDAVSIGMKEFVRTGVNKNLWDWTGHWTGLAFSFLEPLEVFALRNYYGGPAFTWDDIGRFSKGFLSLGFGKAGQYLGAYFGAQIGLDPVTAGYGGGPSAVILQTGWQKSRKIPGLFMAPGWGVPIGGGLR